MTVTVSTYIDTSPDKVFEVVQTKKLLFHVMYPLARFKIIQPKEDSPTWREGVTYLGNSFLLSFLPIGKRHIFIERIDPDKREIQSREHGEIGLKKWDHLILVEPSGQGTKYTDIIEINAGIFTLSYVLFANIFYRLRQAKWRKLVKKNFQF